MLLVNTLKRFFFFQGGFLALQVEQPKTVYLVPKTENHKAITLMLIIPVMLRLWVKCLRDLYLLERTTISYLMLMTEYDLCDLKQIHDNLMTLLESTIGQLLSPTNNKHFH